MRARAGEMARRSSAFARRSSAFHFSPVRFGAAPVRFGAAPVRFGAALVRRAETHDLRHVSLARAMGFRTCHPRFQARNRDVRYRMPKTPRR